MEFAAALSGSPDVDGDMPRVTSERARRAAWAGMPLLVYALVALIITWPLVRHLNSAIAGLGVTDTYEVIRHTWWAREQILHGHNPFDQPLLTYPHPFTSRVMWAYPLQHLPGALLALVMSPVAAVNLVMIATLALNGWAAYTLGMALSDGKRAAAVLGGLVFEALPVVQGHLSVGHPGIISLYGLALFALCWRRVLFAPDEERDARGAWRAAGWGGVWFAITALTYISQLVFVLLPLVALSGLYLLLWDRARLVRRGAALRSQPWLQAGAMLALGGLLITPFYMPLLTDAGRAELGDVAETGRVAFSADLLAFISPSPFGPLDDLGLSPDYARDVLGVNSAEGTAYLGVIAFGLALLALVKRREARLWGFVGLGAMLLSLGPLLNVRHELVQVRFEDYHSYVTLPWAFFQQLPFLDSSRTPGRFNALTGLALSACVSLGAAVLFSGLRRRAVQVALVIACGAVIVVEYQLFSPFPMQDAHLPAYFDTLAQADDVRAVLDLPSQNRLALKIGLYQQIAHHQALIAGYTLRRTAQNPALLAVLDRATAGPDASGLPEISTEMIPYLFSTAGADRVIIHKQFYADAVRVVDRLRGVFGDPEYEDDQIAAFVVPRTDFPPDAFAVAASAEGWSTPVDISDGFTGAFLTGAGEWSIFTGQPFGELTFRSAPYHTPHRIAVWLDDHLIGTWIANGLAESVPVWAEPGFHTLRFELLDGCAPYGFTAECLNSADLSLPCTPVDPPLCLSAALEPPTWTPQSPPTPLPVTLGDGLHLRAYTIDHVPGERVVRVRLYWESAHPLAHSYALFVHIADPVTREPVAQHADYPSVLTTHWDGQAQWVSDVVIALNNDTPDGTYAINAGWFDPVSGDRLTVYGDGPHAADGIITLGTVTFE